MNTITPELGGIKSKHIRRYIELLNKRNIHMHSLLMMRGENIFYEAYWAPFNKNTPHRMYSVTKSFVSVAIGLCVEDGFIKLDDKIIDYFPDKIDTPPCEGLKNQTVREMLTMTTCGLYCDWFTEGDPDRTHLYFSDRGNRRPSGTIWEYDSAGSQVLCALVERVTKKSLFDYLNERIFTSLGTFKNARILKTPNKDSWGDSAMICTTRDLASFARLVASYGVYKGRSLMCSEYLKEATKKQVDNNHDGHLHAFYHGYGYQIWIGEQDSFAFVGMGDQLAICLPKLDLVFCCTADNQGNEAARDYIVNLFFDLIVDNLYDAPVDTDEDEQKKLQELTASLELFALKGAKDSPWREKINGVTYSCMENEMKLTDFTFKFYSDTEGTLTYTKGTRKMELDFYVNKNRFGLFPELGYSKEYGSLRTTDGHKYKDAVSMAWLQDNKIMILVQIIDDYLGNTSLTFAFKGDEATVTFSKTAEDFLYGYNGQAIAKIK